jgi:hypothetical protein
VVNTVTRTKRNAKTKTKKKTSYVRAYGVTSLTAEQASPADLANLVRDHWQVEAHHNIRDTTFKGGRLADPHRQRPPSAGHPTERRHRSTPMFSVQQHGCSPARNGVGPHMPRPQPARSMTRIGFQHHDVKPMWSTGGSGRGRSCFGQHQRIPCVTRRVPLGRAAASNARGMGPFGV